MSHALLGLGETITSLDVAVIDANSEALGVPRLVLMENAGRAVAEIVAQRARPGARVAVYAGTGGNGGDGLAAARHLAAKGFRVKVVLASKPEQLRSSEARIMYRALEAMDYTVDVEVARSVCSFEPPEADVVIDALLGVGLHGAPRSPYAELINAINRSQAGLKVAVDVPSGIDADTGESPGVHVVADITVTLHKPKPGVLRRRDASGEIVVAPIGAPPEAEIYVGPGDVAHRLRRRRWDTRKGRGGRVLVVAGSRWYVGAALLAARAAEAAGVDLVYLASTRNVIEAAMASAPTLIPVVLEGDHLAPEHVEQLRSLAERADAIAAGMGLGLAEETREAVRRLLDLARGLGKPLVLDADGLKHLAAIGPDALGGVKAVLTPHDAEFEKLFGKKPSPVTCIAQRVMDAVEASTAARGAVVLLKGPVDVIAGPGRARLNKTGAPAMSVGGTGDVLAGLVAGIAARGLEPFHAAAVAAYVNGAAGALAYREKAESMNALDVLNRVPRVLAEPERYAGDAVIYRRLPLRSTC